MNIFATDLDRSLMFSSKFLEEGMKSVCIETLEGKEISYMLEESLNLLDKVKGTSGLGFIPVTTRSVEQYKRVSSIQDCEYAITTNGGVILHKGKKYDKWEKHIKEVMLKYADVFNSIPDIVSPFKYAFEKEMRCVDGVFYYVKMNDNPRDIEEFLDFLDKTLDKNIWSYTLQGLKLYIIPNEISKENALKFLAKELNCKYLMACGDGKLDKDFLQIADKVFIPKGSEVLDYICVTDKMSLIPSGLKGTPVLLRNVLSNHLKLVKKKS